jgi:type I restriction enzyme, S subunit
MSSDWPLKNLESVAREVTVGYVGSMATEYVDSGVPFLRSLNVERFGINERDLKYVSKEFHTRIKKSVLRPGDVAIVRTGKPGTCAVIPPWLTEANCSDLVIVRCGHDLRPEFLCYWVNSIASHHISSHTVGAVQQHFNVGAAKKMKVAVPSLYKQDQVTVVLGALDDQITLLRETNATLEAIAHALFKSWFVDFDPVRAKQEGREPEGMDASTAALFPDSFDESELGFIPNGWKIGALQDLLVLQRGFDLPTQDRVPGSFPIIAASGPSGTHKIAMAKGPGVITGRSGVLGRVFLELEDYWPLNTSLWIKEFKTATPCYAYEILRLLDFASFNAGSAVPSLNRNHIHNLKYMLPNIACVIAYENIAIKLHQRVKVNKKQVQTLTSLRDTLLPRLISGQLRLPDATENIELLTGT